jgi:hypothetical protein
MYPRQDDAEAHKATAWVPGSTIASPELTRFILRRRCKLTLQDTARVMEMASLLGGPEDKFRALETFSRVQGSRGSGSVIGCAM